MGDKNPQESLKNTINTMGTLLLDFSFRQVAGTVSLAPPQNCCHWPLLVLHQWGLAPELLEEGCLPVGYLGENKSRTKSVDASVVFPSFGMIHLGSDYRSREVNPYPTLGKRIWRIIDSKVSWQGIPSWGLTCPPQKGTLADDLPFP